MHLSERTKLRCVSKYKFLKENGNEVKKMKIEKRFWKDERWAEMHFPELQKRYLGKWIAIVNEKVVAVAEGPETARKMAKEKTGVTQIPVIFVESGQNLY